MVLKLSKLPIPTAILHKTLLIRIGGSKRASKLLKARSFGEIDFRSQMFTSNRNNGLQWYVGQVLRGYLAT